MCVFVSVPPTHAVIVFYLLEELTPCLRAEQTTAVSEYLTNCYASEIVRLSLYLSPGYGTCTLPYTTLMETWGQEPSLLG